MMRNIVSFVLGIAFTCAMLVLLNRYDKQQIIRRLRDDHELANRELGAEDLVGKWKGKESWGTTFVITRRKDGTFSEVTNFEEADVPHKPAIVVSEGHYFLAGPYYGRYYTKSSDASWVDQEPFIVTLQTFTSTELSYRVEEGDGCREVKQ